MMLTRQHARNARERSRGRVSFAIEPDPNCTSELESLVLTQNTQQTQGWLHPGGRAGGWMGGWLGAKVGGW